MLFSQYYVPTLKEDPAEAETASHRLLLRAGMIRRLTSGIYSYLPLAVRSLEKIMALVRQEMNASGCLEVLLPFVQPAEIWQETGRWDLYGRELMRLKDRHNRDFCLGPTHEEVITDLVRNELRSYRQLPLNLYQIQTKFRDEIRPRFGLMRCREFIMKDAYSFDVDQKACQESYSRMFEAYQKLFSSMGLSFRAVEADSGPIGGSRSHEFMVLAETGEDTIAVCASCGYAANLEKAQVPQQAGKDKQACPQPEQVSTPGMHTVLDVAEYLDLHPARVLKTLLYEADGEPVAALVPGDRELNEVKLRNYLNASELNLASAEQIQAWTGAPMGFSGPKGLQMRILADQSLQADTDWAAGANQADAHLLHLDLDRDAQINSYLDLANIREGDPCPECGAAISFQKGIEVGHVFQLGTKYSRAMQALFLNEQGRQQELYMGCYGIGISRILAAAIEQNHDQQGIIFPPPIAPFEVCILVLNPDEEHVREKAFGIYQDLQHSGLDVLLDDRQERAGFKFKDSDLLGLPLQIIIGSKGLKKGLVEVKDRRSGARQELELEHFQNAFQAWRSQVWSGWGLQEQSPGL
ncbi:MAG: proline--tRNA ligase [Desulfohalobiaceae bacterium]